MYCQTPLNLRIHLLFWCLSSNRHFGTLTLKLLLSPVTKESMTNMQNTTNASESSFWGSVLLLIIRATFWNSYYKNCAEPHSGPKYGQFAKHCLLPFIHRSPLVYLCVTCKQLFVVLSVKYLLNQITIHKMASLENIVTRFRIIVLCYSSALVLSIRTTLWSTYREIATTPLWRKRWSICKILSHASKWSFSFSHLVLIVWATLCSC